MSPLKEYRCSGRVHDPALDVTEAFTRYVWAESSAAASAIVRASYLLRGMEVRGMSTVETIPCLGAL